MKNLSKTLRLSALACACAAACVVQAQSQAVPQLKEVVITATLHETRVDELVSDVVVVTRSQLEKSAGLTLPEVLARSAGVQFSSNGGLGKSSSIYIRGGDPRHTILLIDGVRTGSATTGTASWENIPVNMIERIEVLKGPASALYGSDGAGGVVQVFTRLGKAGFFPNAAVTLGSNDYSQVSAGFNGGTGNLTYTLGLQRTKDGGFSATNAKNTFSFNPDDDGFKQNAVNASLRWKFTNDWAFDAKLLHTDGISQFDDGPGAVDTKGSLGVSSVAVGVEGVVVKGWKSRISYAQSQDKSTQLTTNSAFTTVPSIFNTKQTQIGWKNDVQTPIGLAIVGLEYLKQDVDSTQKFAATDRAIRSVYMGLNGSSGAHSWQANVRNDRNTQFGTSNTGFAGYGFAVTPEWRLNASYGTTFVAPTFNQLYYVSPFFSGNPNLVPEKGASVDLGVAYSNSGHTVKLVHFDNKVKNLLASNAAFNSTINIGKSRMEGWTLAYDGQIGPWTLRASYDELNARNLDTGKLLTRRARHQASLAADYAAGNWQVGGQMLKNGATFNNAANTNAGLLNGYTTLDLNATYKVNQDWALQAKINNVTNREHQNVLGYNQPGRGVFATLRYEPK